MAHSSRTQEVLSLFAQVVDDTKKSGVDALVLTALLRSQRGVGVYSGAVDAVEIADEIKIGIWVGEKQRWGVGTLESLEAKALTDGIARVREVARFSDPEPDYSLAVAQAVPKPIAVDDHVVALTTQQLTDMSCALETKAKAFSPLVKNIPHAGVGFDLWERILVNSSGARVSERNLLLRASLSVMAQGSDGRMVNNHESEAVATLRDYHEAEIIKVIAGEAVQRTNPRSPKSGAYPVLLTPEAAAHVLAALIPSFSGDLLYRKLSRLEGQLGKKIAANGVSLQDAGPTGLVPHHFDGEGQLCQEKYLISDGTFQTFLHNRYTAAKLKTQSTGNGTEPMGAAPGVGPMNLAWGGLAVRNVDDLLSEMKSGILIKELQGASASPVSGDFSYGALGYWVEAGKVAYPLADFTVAGNFFTLLKEIVGVGDDLKFIYAHLLGSYGGRSLLVRELAVSGTG